MLAHRIRVRADFLRCYDQGRRFFSSEFVLFAAPRMEAVLPWRLGMAVTKKCGSAVWRNRLRRLIREAFRLRGHAIADGYDYVVVPKRNVRPRTLNLAQVSAQLAPLLCAVAKNTPRREPA